MANTHPSNEACDSQCQETRQICDGNHDEPNGHRWCIATCYETTTTHTLTPPVEDD